MRPIKPTHAIHPRMQLEQYVKNVLMANLPLAAGQGLVIKKCHSNFFYRQERKVLLTHMFSYTLHIIHCLHCVRLVCRPTRARPCCTRLTKNKVESYEWEREEESVTKCDTKEDWENQVYTLRRPLGVCKIT
jgi:hypothetical protein